MINIKLKLGFFFEITRQFSEILRLLSEIKKEQKRLLMLKHQFHSAQMKQEVGVLNETLLKQSGKSTEW